MRERHRRSVTAAVVTVLAISLPCIAWYVAGSRSARQEMEHIVQEPKLAARQGNAEANSTLPVMVSGMTEEELKKARYKVSKFSVKATKTDHHRTRTPLYDSRDSARQRIRSGGTPGY